MSRFRNEDGFTVMEMLVAATVGFIVLAGVLGLLETTVRLNTGVLAKTDAMQRGRIALDTVTQQLRSQVCLDYANSAIMVGSDADTVTFYADYTEDGKVPVRRKITFDATKSQLRTYTYAVPPLTPTPPPVSAFPASPTTQNLVLEGIKRQTDPVTKASVPFLRYYAYKTIAGRVLAEEELPPPLDAAEAARVARVDVSYFVLPTGSKDDTKGVNLSDQVMARHADPNLSVPDPNCV